MEPFDREAEAAKLRHTFVVDVHEGVKTLKFYSNLTFFVALLGIALMVGARELEWSSPGQYTTVILMLRCFNSVNTALLLYLLYKFHQAEFHIDRMNQGFLDELVFWPTYRIRTIAAEFLICIIHDYPGLDALIDITLPADNAAFVKMMLGIPLVPVVVPNPWSLFMFMRLYLIGRVMRDRAFSSGSVTVTEFLHY